MNYFASIPGLCLPLKILFLPIFLVIFLAKDENLHPFSNIPSLG